MQAFLLVTIVTIVPNISLIKLGHSSRSIVSERVFFSSTAILAFQFVLHFSVAQKMKKLLDNCHTVGFRSHFSMTGDEFLCVLEHDLICERCDLLL